MDNTLKCRCECSTVRNTAREIFNLLNRTNFDVPNRIAFTPNFGRIFSAKEPREMQFGVKLSF